MNGFENYIAWKIFNTGINRDVDRYKNGSIETAYAVWNLTEKQ